MKKISVANFQIYSENQNGQAVIVMLLFMLILLSVGLAFSQRSVTDVSNSTQVEQATRAFSAAEAGIQKALSSPLPQSLNYSLTLDNNSSAKVDSSGLLPYSSSAAAGIEYPKIGRETTAHFWFVDPSVVGPPVAYYTHHSFDLYYGNAGTTDLPAVEVSLVIESGGNYYTKSYYFDSSADRTNGPNRNYFTQTTPCNTQSMPTGILGNGRTFFCKQLVGPIKDPVAPATDCNGTTCKLILARARFIYVTENHSLALAPLSNSKFPPQVQIYNATGTSGQSQKQIQAFKVKDVVLPWFDFALFSTNELRK